MNAAGNMPVRAGASVLARALQFERTACREAISSSERDRPRCHAPVKPTPEFGSALPCNQSGADTQSAASASVDDCAVPSPPLKTDATTKRTRSGTLDVRSLISRFESKCQDMETPPRAARTSVRDLALRFENWGEQAKPPRAKTWTALPKPSQLGTSAIDLNPPPRSGTLTDVANKVLPERRVSVGAKKKGAVHVTSESSPTAKAQRNFNHLVARPLHVIPCVRPRQQDGGAVKRPKPEIVLNLGESTDKREKVKPVEPCAVKPVSVLERISQFEKQGEGVLQSVQFNGTCNLTKPTREGKSKSEDEKHASAVEFTTRSNTDEDKSSASLPTIESSKENSWKSRDSKGASTIKCSTTSWKDESQVADAPFTIPKCRQSPAELERSSKSKGPKDVRSIKCSTTNAKNDNEIVAPPPPTAECQKSPAELGKSAEMGEACAIQSPTVNRNDKNESATAAPTITKRRQSPVEREKHSKEAITSTSSMEDRNDANEIAAVAPAIMKRRLSKDMKDTSSSKGLAATENDEYEIAYAAPATSRTRRSNEEFDRNSSSSRNTEETRMTKLSTRNRSRKDDIIVSPSPNTKVYQPMEEYKDWISLPNLAEFRPARRIPTTQGVIWRHDYSRGSLSSLVTPKTCTLPANYEAEDLPEDGMSTLSSEASYENPRSGVIVQVMTSLARAHGLLDNRTVRRAHMCSDFDLLHRRRRSAGWECGHLCASSMISCLLLDSNMRFKLYEAGITNSPSIREVSQLIEDAWAAGFDVEGAAKYSGTLVGRRAYLGATEVAVLLISSGIPAQTRAFPANTPLERRVFFDWVLAHFDQCCAKSGGCSVHRRRRRRGNRDDCVIVPLFVSWPMRACLIVGVERLRNGGIRLLVIEPTAACANVLTGRSVKKRVAVVRRGESHPQWTSSRQYHVVYVDQLDKNESILGRRFSTGRILQNLTGFSKRRLSLNGSSHHAKI